MAVTDWWLGHATDTTAVVVFRSDATATITLTVNGSSFTGSADTAVGDGIVAIEATGLSAGQSYAFTGDASGTLKTMPTSGSFNFGVISCIESGRIMVGGYRMIEEGIAGFATLGDFPYTERSAGGFGLSVTSTNASQTEAVFHGHYLVAQRNPGLYSCSHYAPKYVMHDDHEFPGDDWDHSITQANDGGTGGLLPASVQSDVDTVWANGNTAGMAWRSGNPSNADANAIAEAPGEAAAAAANYPPQYCRFSIGDAEFFLLDTLSHKDAIADADTGTYPTHNKTCLGTNQRTWLLAQLAASTKTFKIILSPKRLFGSTTLGNTDSWAEYAVERDGILAAIHASVTGVCWVTGDQHMPAVAQATVVADGFDVLEMCCCPVGVESQTGFVFNNDVWNFDNGGIHNQVYGIVHVEGSEYVELRMHAVMSGEIKWSGRVYAGSNALSYPDNVQSIGLVSI